MRKGILISLLLALMMYMGLVSCQSREQRAISRLYDLSERIEKHGDDYLLEDWLETYQDFSEIASDLDYCFFTPYQKQKVDNLERSLYRKILRGGITSFLKGQTTDLDFLNLYQIEDGYTLELDKIKDTSIDSVVEEQVNLWFPKYPGKQYQQ